MRRALPIALALALGLLLGRATASAPEPPTPPGAASPGPTQLGAGGVGTGFEHTRAGALAAAGTYQQAFAETAILRPAQLRRRIEAVATPAYAPALLAANEPGARRLWGGTLGEGIRSGVPTAYLGTPVSYRLDSYSPQRAVIRTWGFTVLGNATTAEPAAYFGTARTELAWLEGDWKIAASRAAYGPTPRLLTPRKGGEGFGLLDFVAGM